MSLRRQIPRQSSSPTATLLRNSRLFSLPDPLPRPSVATQVYGSGAIKSSNTATLPYPTHQAIATTQSSLARGDWGLKRPLPSRSHLVQSSKPVVRIRQLDTIEHITDFESASDHVRTREKFAEMSTPMLQGATGSHDLSALKPNSVFEETMDVTSYDGTTGLTDAGKYFEALKQNVAATSNRKDAFEPTPRTPLDAIRAAPGTIRWKHEGPWIPGMGSSEFNFYVSKQLTSRRAEFEKYLVQWVKDKLYMQRTDAYLRSGAHLDADISTANAQYAAKSASFKIFTQSEIDAEVRKLREQCAADPLKSVLVQSLILPFLRLPPMKVKAAQFAESAVKTDKGKKFEDGTTPISTHPSAGLSYLRTKSYMANHPILGPQRHTTPITARVVQPRQAGTSTREATARLGVAGFVADDEFRDNSNAMLNARNRGEMQGVQFLDITTPGGHKLEVDPLFASVDVEGRVHVKVLRRNGEEVMVKRGMLRDGPPVLESAKQGEKVDVTDLGIGKSGIKALDQLAGVGDEVDAERAEKSFFEKLEKLQKEGKA